jgi:hypothetical protein
MTQALYAHMNNKTIKKKKEISLLVCLPTVGHPLRKGVLSGSAAHPLAPNVTWSRCSRQSMRVKRTVCLVLIVVFIHGPSVCHAW